MPRSLLVTSLLFVVLNHVRVSGIQLGIQNKNAGVSYRAAVVEALGTPANCDPADIGGCVASVLYQNIDAMDKWAGKAAAQGAQIVVFPETYVYSGWSISMPSLLDAFMEPLPTAGTVLCEKEAGNSSRIAQAVACVAKKHKLVIVTGIGDKAPCVKKVHPFTKRPFPCNKQTGLGNFNSMAAFGIEGEMLAKYHKSHLARSWGSDLEPGISEADTPEAVSFVSHFGVRFGMIACHDIQFPEPSRSLVNAGVGDWVYSAFWNNLGATATSLGVEESTSRLYGVNLLASSSNAGRISSGSGIWPADTEAKVSQYFNEDYADADNPPHPTDGWMGVTDLISTTPLHALPPLPQVAEKEYYKTFPNVWFEKGTVDGMLFKAHAGKRIEHSLKVAGMECNLKADVENDGGVYAFMGVAGLHDWGIHRAMCAVVFCHDEDYASCEKSFFRSAKKTLPAGADRAVFSNLTLEVKAEHARTYRYSALCDSHQFVSPRSAASLREDGEWRHLSLPHACPVESFYVDGRFEDEDPKCPITGCPKDPVLMSRGQLLKRRPWVAPLEGWRMLENMTRRGF